MNNAILVNLLTLKGAGWLARFGIPQSYTAVSLSHRKQFSVQRKTDRTHCEGAWLLAFHFVRPFKEIETGTPRFSSPTTIRTSDPDSPGMDNRDCRPAQIRHLRRLVVVEIPGIYFTTDGSNKLVSR